MIARELSELNANLFDYLKLAVGDLYKKACKKTGKRVVKLRHQVSLDDEYYAITGLTIDKSGELMFTQVNEYEGKEDPQYVYHLGIDQLIELLEQLETITGELFDKPFNWCNTGTEYPTAVIEVDGGSFIDAHTDSSFLNVYVIDYAIKRKTPLKATFKPQYVPANKKPGKKLQAFMAKCCKRD